MGGEGKMNLIVDDHRDEEMKSHETGA